jgi:hypothetical protein
MSASLWRWVLRVTAAVSLVIAVAWFAHNPGFEPILTLLGAVAAFIGSLVVPDAPTKEPTESDAPHDPAPIPVLEVPTGVVPLDSPFYVRRWADEQLEGQLAQSGTITTVRGSRQAGKTSLLARGIAYAQERGLLVISLDFQELLEGADLLELDRFLKYLAYAIADRAAIPAADIESKWARPLSAKARMTRFMEGEILQSVSTPVVLVLDEADMLFDTSFYGDFFGLLRSWHNRRATDPLWEKLSIVMAISTHPSLLIDDVNQSPFNVGLTIDLEDLDEEQVCFLNGKHDQPLWREDVPKVMALLGGQPFLIRQALYTLVTEKKTWPQLEPVIDKEDGPFGSHLRYYLGLLQGDAELWEAMRQVVFERKCPDTRELLRLEAAGLVRECEDGRCVCRYGLYARFFGRRL